MKKVTALFLLGATLCGLIGCQKSSPEASSIPTIVQEEQSTVEQTNPVSLTPSTVASSDETVEVTTQSALPQKNPYIVTELTMVGDSYTLSFPQLEGSDEITCDFYNQLWLDMAEDYATQAAADPDLSYTLNFQVMTLTDDLLSILFKGQSIYAGAAYPTNFYLTYNIDLKSGETVRLANSPKLPKIVDVLSSRAFDFHENYAYLAEFKDQVFVGHDTSMIMTRLSSADYQVKLTKGGLALADESHPTDFTYYEDGELRILVQVIHALGDYVVIIPTIE